jgi:5'-deoxynucleotidase YfbR-like HD superfamily hydrolase
VSEFHTLYRAGNSVKRYHNRDIPPQTLAEHQWGVALVLMHIAPTKYEALLRGLTHDLAEWATGDIPHGFKKRASSTLRAELASAEHEFEFNYKINYKLSPDDEQMVSWADMFELCLYCKRHAHTHPDAADILKAGLKYMDGYDFPSVAAETLFYETFPTTEYK